MALISVIDYGMGNLSSVSKALESSGGVNIAITSSAEKILSSDGVVLPGVGAFDAAVRNLKKSGLWKILPRLVSDKPFLGICLGFQLLYEGSEEGNEAGLGILKGKIKLFRSRRYRKLRVPHIGWNNVEYKKNENRPPALSGIPSGAYFYFVHSYYAPLIRVSGSDSGDKEIIRCHTTYGDIKFCSAVSFNSGRSFACQFHPEKSSEDGLRVIKNFVSSVK